MANRMMRNKSPAVAVGRRIAFSGKNQHAWHDSGRTRVDADDGFEDDNMSEVDSDTEKSLMCERGSTICPEDADQETRMSFQRMSFISQQRMSFMSTASASSVGPDIKRVGTGCPAKGNPKTASNASSFSTAASGSMAVEDFCSDRMTFEESDNMESFGRSMGKALSFTSNDDISREILGRGMGKAPSSKLSSSSGTCAGPMPVLPPIPSSTVVVARPASLLRSGRNSAGGLPDNECPNECLDEFVTEYECKQQFNPSPSLRAVAMSKPSPSLLPTTSRPGSTEPSTLPGRGIELCTAKVLVRGITASSAGATATTVRAPEKTQNPFRGAAPPFECRQPLAGPRCDTVRQSFNGAGSDAVRQSFNGVSADAVRQSFNGAGADAVRQSFNGAGSDAVRQSFNGAGSDASRQTFNGACSDAARQTFTGAGSDAAKQTFTGAGSDTAKQTFTGAGFDPARLSFASARCDTIRQTFTGASGDAGTKCPPTPSSAGMTRDPCARECADIVPRAESLSPVSARMVAMGIGVQDNFSPQGSFAGSDQPDQRAATRVLATTAPTAPATRRTTNPFRRTPPGGRPSH